MPCSRMPKCMLPPLVMEMRKIGFAIQEGHGRGCYICGTTDQLRNMRSEHVETLPLLTRVAIPLASAGKGLRPASHPDGSLRIEDQLRSRPLPSDTPLRQAANRSFHA
jgi:hypothetical protein